MGLAQEIQSNQKKSFFKKISFFLGIIILFGIGYQYFYNTKDTNSITKTQEFLVKKGDLKTSIESDGKIVLKDIYQLDFNTSGLLKKILKQEGDQVKKGELIAQIDDEYLQINLEKAQLALKTAQSNYEVKKRGSTKEEISAQKSQVDANNISLENTKNQADISLQDAIDNKNVLNENLENIKSSNEISLINAENNLQSAKSDYETSQKNLELITKQENEKYINAQNKLLMEAGQIISTIEEKLFDIDVLLGISQENKYQNDSFELYLGAKNTSTKQIAENSYIETKKSFDDFYLKWKIFRENNNLDELNIYANDLKEISGNVNKTLNYTTEVLKNSITSSSLSQNTLDTYITSFEKSLSDNKSDTATFGNLILTTQEAKTSADIKIDTANNQVISAKQKYDTAQISYNKTVLENKNNLTTATQKLSQAENDIISTQYKNQALISKDDATLKISQNILDTKTKVDPLDLKPFLLAIEVAEKNLQEAQKKLDDSKIFSPIDGKIVDISGKIGDQVNALKTPFVTIINKDTLYIESQVEEGDILKIKENQNVNITFDSIDGLTFTGNVIYINDKANIDTNGVVTYEVKIIFQSNDQRVKDAMSVNVEYITKEVKNILIIPVSAVKTVNKKPSVQDENGKYIPVITGFTDGKMVEVISGLSLGQKILY